MSNVELCSVENQLWISTKLFEMFILGIFFFSKINNAIYVFSFFILCAGVSGCWCANFTFIREKTPLRLYQDRQPIGPVDMRETVATAWRTHCSVNRTNVLLCAVVYGVQHAFSILSSMQPAFCFDFVRLALKTVHSKLRRKKTIFSRVRNLI